MAGCGSGNRVFTQVEITPPFGKRIVSEKCGRCGDRSRGAKKAWAAWSLRRESKLSRVEIPSPLGKRGSRGKCGRCEVEFSREAVVSGSASRAALPIS